MTLQSEHIPHHHGAAHGPHDGHGTSHGTGHGSMGHLMLGFGLAAALTIIPFGLVIDEVEIARSTFVAIIMGLGAVQILVHLVYFLHVNRSAEEGWTMAATSFAVLILVILLSGSLWVMHNMNEHMMPMHGMKAGGMQMNGMEMDKMRIDQMRSLQSQEG